jgi:multiple sugar transport system substrate-binding protein
MANCQVIIDSGRKCYTIGTKFLWTAGGWFDYLNMRTNGFDFHMALARGEVPGPMTACARPSPTGAADRHGRLHRRPPDLFSWQEALPFMINGEATAYLMGNFAVDQLRNGGSDGRSAGLLPVPGDQPRCRNGRRCAHRHVPRRLRRAERGGGARVPAYVTSPDVQTAINGPDGSASCR